MVKQVIGKCLVSLGILAILSGCGSSRPAYIDELVPMSGVVTLDGKPLAGAHVTFLAQDGVSRQSSAVTDADGKYVMTTDAGYPGVLPGAYAVTISKLVMPDGSAPPPNVAPMDVGAQETIPDRYSSVAELTLTAEVPKEGGTRDFALESKRKIARTGR